MRNNDVRRYHHDEHTHGHTHERHEHAHSGGHGHHHDEHEHHHHEHNEATELVEQSLVLSRHGSLALHSPVEWHTLAATLEGALQRIAQKLAVQGVLAGHIKALVRAKDTQASFSVTRVGETDSANNGIEGTLSQLELTVNIISMVNTDKVDERALDALFAEIAALGA